MSEREAPITMIRAVYSTYSDPIAPNYSRSGAATYREAPGSGLMCATTLTQ